MKILFISDLLFDKPTKAERINREYTDPFGKIINVQYSKSIVGYDVSDHIKLIKSIKPDLILIGGDLTDEFKFRSPPDDIFSELVKFLNFINEKKIQCYIVEGNHDVYFFDKVKKVISELEYIKDISNKIAEFMDIRILGLSYSFISKLKNCRVIREKFPEKFDIVLAHAELKRRIWLFDLKTKYILTGHAFLHLDSFSNMIYCALEHSPRVFVVLEKFSDKDILTIHVNNFWEEIDYKKNPPVISPIIKEQLETQLEITKQGIKMKKNEISIRKYPFKLLHKTKRIFSDLDEQEKEESVNDLLSKGASKTVIRDYLNWGFYKCNRCGKRFPSNYSLERHLEKHPETSDTKIDSYFS